VQIARSGAQQLSELTGRAADTVSGMERTDNGWLVQVEVVELERIPDTTSVMASYEVELDAEGTMLSYRRSRRYYRNQAGD
jgi:gas vesicle protein GvpO